MKFYIDVPTSFSVTHYHNHAEIRQAYQTIIAAALRLNIPMELFKAVPYLGSEENKRFEEGIFYAFHAERPRKNSYCVKPSALPGLWYFDSGGYSGWSEIANNPALHMLGDRYDQGKADATIEHYRRRFTEENFSALRQSNDDLEPEIASLDEFVFYPLQVNSDEVLKLGRLTQFEAIRRLAELAQRHGKHVVLKRHPLCDSQTIEKMLEEVSDNHLLHVSRCSVHRLIPKSRCILVSNSGVGLQALIHGKAVYTLASSEYAHMTAQIADIDALERLFLDDTPVQAPEIRRQLGYLLNEYWVDISSEDAIARRLEAHVQAFQASTQAAVSQNEPEQKPALSILHRANKELGDIIELILLTYKNLDDPAKKRVAGVLVRAVGAGHKVEQILRQTDGHVWRKCINVIRQRNPSRALGLAREIVKESPADSWALLTLSKTLYALNNTTEGMEAAQRATEVDGPIPEALVFLGRKLLQLEPIDLERVSACAEKAIVVDQNCAHAHWLQARALSFQAKYADALKAASKAAALNPEDPAFLKLRDDLRKHAELEAR
ncbi:hypothetical protein [Sinorhizobium sp. RAC02]|uniref:capsular polysaccharide export protein, LipB/KpsS family n=1 Tax=Sinorhizobium sp. RAC02 TaxID=1842534 RepID=UPI00083D9F6A|nr:hypothetical protein [Sinorhizobium sp. RAC02]AOF91821.1 capsule polysaccharide biosynthesis family protein [Sinorhizobium sp. RAC02]